MKLSWMEDINICWLKPAVFLQECRNMLKIAEQFWHARKLRFLSMNGIDAVVLN